jgi:hypothetical protein
MSKMWSYYNLQSQQAACTKAIPTRIASDGQTIDMNIFNISDNGIGVEIPAKMIRSHGIKVGKKFRFECNWNPHLVRNSSFIIRNIYGQRIGLEKIRRGGW